MKILSFSYCFPNRNNPSWGIFVYQRLAMMAKYDEVRICSPVPWFPFLNGSIGKGPAEVESRGNVTIYRPRFFYFPGILKNHDARFYACGIGSWFQKLSRIWRPDILDAHFIWPDGVGVAEIARKNHLPYSITLRGKIYECLPIASQRRQCAKALQNAAAVVSVSGLMANEAEKLGASAERIAVIPNGVDKEKFAPCGKTEARLKLGLPQDGKLIVTVAHLGHRKGHHETIEALSGLDEDVRLCIVGGPAQGGTPEILLDLARKLGVAERLILPGRRPYEEIPLYFNAADVSVLASYREGCPNAVLESLACGTPVVASDVGAVRDILPVPRAGRIVPRKNPGALRAALIDVLGRDWRQEDVMRESGVKSWDDVALDSRNVLAKALARKTAGAPCQSCCNRE